MQRRTFLLRNSAHAWAPHLPYLLPPTDGAAASVHTMDARHLPCSRGGRQHAEKSVSAVPNKDQKMKYKWRKKRNIFRELDATSGLLYGQDETRMLFLKTVD